MTSQGAHTNTFQTFYDRFINKVKSGGTIIANYMIDLLIKNKKPLQSQKNGLFMLARFFE